MVETTFVDLLKDFLRRRKLLPSQLAGELGISHATVSRWLSGKTTPDIKSYQKLADYSGIPLNQLLAKSGYLKKVSQKGIEWPEFREYAKQKYPKELDEDMITMIEDHIERRRQKIASAKNK